MKNFTFIQWMVILILSLLTALEPLSIDLYLPAFLLISETFSVSDSAVQISLSTFLAGFAIGQLFWGPLADRFGRKKPIIISLLIFIAASISCIFATSIKYLWVLRFIQAIGGCGGIVISRAIVTDYFDRSKTLKIFTLLALIMSIAPIVAPIIGSSILAGFGWKGIFAAMAFLGAAMLLLTVSFLPETHKSDKLKERVNILRDYLNVLSNKRFTYYALIAGVANGALMVYVGNGPFLIMDYGGLSGNSFSIVFATNALGLMIASYLTAFLQKVITTQKIVRYALMMMFGASVLLLSVMYFIPNIYIILAVLFFFIFPIGILFPATTELAMSPFTENSGTASALFGSIQLFIAFICTIVANAINNDSILSTGFAFFICGLFAILFIFGKVGVTSKVIYKI